MLQTPADCGPRDQIKSSHHNQPISCKIFSAKKVFSCHTTTLYLHFTSKGVGYARRYNTNRNRHSLNALRCSQGIVTAGQCKRRRTHSRVVRRRQKFANRTPLSRPELYRYNPRPTARWSDPDRIRNKPLDASSLTRQIAGKQFTQPQRNWSDFRCRQSPRTWCRSV